MLSRRQILTSTTAAATVAAVGLPVAAQATLAPTPVQLAAEKYFAAWEAREEHYEAVEAIERRSPYYEAHEQYLAEHRAIVADFSIPREVASARLNAHDKAHADLDQKHCDWRRAAGYDEGVDRDEELYHVKCDAFDALMATEAETLGDVALMALAVEIENGADPYAYDNALGVGALVRKARTLLPLPEGFTLPARLA